jgi:uncharacterized protein
MIVRTDQLRTLEWSFTWSPVVGLVGPRQVGKTTLARALAGRSSSPTYYDLENPRDRARLADPLLALESARGLVVIDEIHHVPELFPVLRVLVDRGGVQFLVLGSASPDLLRQGSESLAGRITWHELGGFSLDEVGAAAAEALWIRGGFPRSFLASGDAESAAWRRSFVQTFLERDLPALGVRTPTSTLSRFWSMLAHWHGQLWNGAEFARAFGMSEPTVRGYLDLLDQAYVVRVVRPWHENLAKRQVRSPRVYLRDSGLLHTLLDVETPERLHGHPLVGASWEGFALGAVIDRLRARRDQCWFWRTHAGAELDLLVTDGDRRLGFEFKRTSSPSVTRSMHTALADLKLESLTVVYPGPESFPLADRIRAVGIQTLLEQIVPLSSVP